MQLSNIIIERIRRVTSEKKVALHEPYFNGNERAYVNECIDSGWVSSVGSYVDRFEQELANYTRTKYAVVVNNCTSGLQIALQIVGVKPGDEVLVPALSFVATANAVRHCGAHPHFIDSDFTTLGVGVEALIDYLSTVTELKAGGCFNKHSGRRIGAILPMHTFGHPVSMIDISELANKYGIPVVEDAAESLGSWIGNQHTGSFGRCGVLSFNGNKIITTGGGGAIITNDAELARRAKHLTSTAKIPHAWSFFHDEVAYNYRMPNLNAALGCAQLEQLPEFLKAKRELTQRYLAAFKDVREVQLFTESSGTTANYWLQTLLISASHADLRDEILKATNQVGLMTRPVWELLTTLPMYINCESMEIPIAQQLSRRIINLPSSPQIIFENP